ncbi:hypothetical protein ABEB36_007379 [Hypothenemus hampei]|uniref:Acyltransferase 3 domain-containing protein n=1 Tax=Hypothenemus hampei TaxID=57062 RepID=A0ABD1ETS1_HYPHA
MIAVETLFILIFIFFLIILIRESFKSKLHHTDPAFKNLPPIFRIDDENSCRKNNHLYCKASIVLQPIDWNNTYWKVIQDTINHPKFYNHNELFHAFCLNECDLGPSPSGLLEGKISECYKKKYANVNLDFVIKELNCNEPQGRNYSSALDQAVLCLVIIYMAFVLFATYQEYCRSNNSAIKKFDHPIVRNFSLISNWKKLCSINKSPDFQKLKFIQGIRFYNMLLVVFCHTQCSYIAAYILNTEYLEQVHRNPVKRFIITQSVFLVQTFFLLSAFLLSYHVRQSMEGYKESKIRYVFITFLNRYLRILPPVLAMMILCNTSWVMMFFDGPLNHFYSDKEFRRCQENWWANLLFINNHYNQNDMCYFITWYLSADTQLYLFSLLILLLIWKFPRKSKVILVSFILIGIIIPTMLCWKYGLDVIFRLTPERAKIDNYRSFEFNAIYTSTYSNMTSYMIGLALGFFYFHLEKTKIKSRNHKYRQLVLMTLFAFLPFTTILISSTSHSKIWNIILAGLVKPIYALGIGAGILAMSQQKGGLIKKICEFRPILFLGNFTYSTYVVQYGIVFYRTAVTRRPLYVSDYVMGKSFLQDAVLSIIFGFLMHILVEMPAIQLQKLYIPQIRRNLSKKCSSN